MLWPIQPTANNRIAAAIDTKMSLKPVKSRNCSSSGIAVALLLHMRAQRVRVLGADHACGNGIVKLLLAVHAAFLLFRIRIDRVYYSVNTARQLTLASRIHMAVTDTRRIA